MVRLSDEDREALIDALYLMLCEHGWGDHYNCGGPDEPMCSKEWAERESIADIFNTIVAPAIARHVAAALNEAARVIEAWEANAERATDSATERADIDKCRAREAAYRRAARIVRNLAANDGP